MAVGQGAFSGSVDPVRLAAVEALLEADEADRGRRHVELLRHCLQLAALHLDAGTSLSTVPQLALVLRCSEHRAQRLLTDAAGLDLLPGGLDAVATGLVTVEQSTVVVTQLGVLALPVRLQVWARLLQQLRAELEQGVSCPPARLAELLRRLVISTDPDGAVDRRKDAARGRTVDYRRRDDGLTDVLLLGTSGPNAEAVLSRIRAHSAPVGADDERTADERRHDAAIDLLLGRQSLRFGQDVTDDDAEESHCRPYCACTVGAPVPCGVQVVVHVPLGAALGTTDEVADVVGHGPIDADQLRQLLLAAPVLRAVHVDSDGVPVCVGDRLRTPERGDPTALRQALLDLAAAPPGTRHPVHPADHVPQPPSRGTPPTTEPWERTGAHPSDVLHPTGQPGSYRVSTRLRRLIDVRAPRCEWPGCGARAARCDAEHDTAWPDGPTCACNLGPLCRRHHRVKQQGWTKQRTTRSAVRWTNRAGRSWTSPSQHTAPTTPVRRPAPLPTASPWDELNPLALEQELWLLDPTADHWDDPHATELRATDHDPLHQDVTAEQLAGDTRWTYDLDDPYGWLDERALAA